jgi:hypothetical protein
MGKAGIIQKCTSPLPIIHMNSKEGGEFMSIRKQNCIRINQLVNDNNEQNY